MFKKIREKKRNGSKNIFNPDYLITINKEERCHKEKNRRKTDKTKKNKIRTLK